MPTNTKLVSALHQLSRDLSRLSENASVVADLMEELDLAGTGVDSGGNEEVSNEDDTSGGDDGAEEEHLIPKTGCKFVVNTNKVLISSWKTYVLKKCPNYEDLFWLYEGAVEFENTILEMTNAFRTAPSRRARANAVRSTISLMENVEFVVMENQDKILRYADADEIFDCVKDHLKNSKNKKRDDYLVAAAKAEEEATGDALVSAAKAEEEVTGDALVAAAKAEEEASDGSTTSVKTPSSSSNTAASVIVGSKRPALVTPTNPGPTPAKKPASSSKLGLGKSSSSKKQVSLLAWRN